jgi:hypothetical protein
VVWELYTAINPPIRLLFFPARVGATITQHATLAFSQGGTGNLTVVSKIVGKGAAIVGAGTFPDSVMAQHKVEITGAEPQKFIRYEWYAPFVGRVALIQSKNGETKELFTTADAFEWMKKCVMP